MTFYHFDVIFRQLRPTAARSISHMPAQPTGAAQLLVGPERLSCSPQHGKRAAKVVRAAARACTTTCFSSIRARGTEQKEYKQPPHRTVGAGVQQLGCTRQQLTLHPAQLERGVPATLTAASDRACALQSPLCDPEPRQRPLAPTEPLCTAHKTPSQIGTVPPFLRAAVSGAVRSQFWADFAQTEICHGARTRR